MLSAEELNNNSLRSITLRLRFYYALMVVGLFALSCDKSTNSEDGFSNSLLKHYKIAFMSGRLSIEEGWEIFLANTDDAIIKRLTYNSRIFSHNPSWSPDGTKIAYISATSGQEDWIFIVNSDGADQTLLTTQDIQLTPEWSPDGTKIAFWGNGLYVINIDGTNEQLIGSSSSAPSWSPNGTKITFATALFSSSVITIVNSDGSEQTGISSDSLDGLYPDWSSDGIHIVFNSSRNHINDDIYMVNSDGTDERNLTDDSFMDDFTRFSPDGTKIAFRSDRDGNLELYLMELDGSSLHRLTDVQGDVLSQFDWSPDGNDIVFTESDFSNGCSDCNIWIVTIEGTEQKNLTPGSHTINMDPAWSPIQLP